MTEPFMGEIRLFSMAFAPKGWALCNGQTLPINQNQGLFSLLGTMYGGDGRTTFALPNLQSRVIVGQGTDSDTSSIGEIGGAEAITLNQSQLPAHSHGAHVATTATQTMPTGALPAATGSAQFAAAGASQTFASAAISSAPGGGQPHENRQPYLVMSYCIATEGIFPSQN